MMTEFSLHIRPRVSPALGRALDRLLPCAGLGLERRGLTGKTAAPVAPGLPHGDLGQSGPGPGIGPVAAGATEYIRPAPQSTAPTARPALDPRSAKGGLPGEFEIQTHDAARGATPWTFRKPGAPGATNIVPRDGMHVETLDVHPNEPHAKGNVHWLAPDAAPRADAAPRTDAAPRQSQTPGQTVMPRAHRTQGAAVLTSLLGRGTSRRAVALVDHGAVAAPMLAPAGPQHASGLPHLPLAERATANPVSLYGALAPTPETVDPRHSNRSAADRNDPSAPRDMRQASESDQGGDQGHNPLSDIDFDQRLQDALARLLSQDLLRHGLGQPGDV